MALADTDLEVRAWLDRLAIQDLIYRYCDAVTRGDWDQCEAVFTPDVVWECPVMGMRFDGRGEFIGTLKRSPFEVLIQTASAPVIILTEPGRAQATTTILEIVRGVAPLDTTYGAAGAESNFTQYGVYFDDIARMDGDWRFTHRLFTPIFVTTDSVTGEVMTQRSDLLRVE
jgi:hypothetical protein